MFTKALILLFAFHIAKTHTDQLEMDCHVLKTVDDVQTRLENAVAEIVSLKESLASLKTEFETMKSSEPGSFTSSNVVFHVKGIREQPLGDSPIRFSTVIENSGGAYDMDTGCFTAPSNGVYWFSAEICTRVNQSISPTLFVRGVLVNRAYVRDTDNVTCGSVSAAASLGEGDEVCLKTSGYQGIEPMSFRKNYNTNNFMGVKIH